MATKPKAVSTNGANLNRYLDSFSIISKNSDFAFAAALCVILGILFVPLPTFLLDFGLAMSFAISIVVMMVAIWVKKPLEFNSFPTLLLVITVMRLALGIASTRLILSEGHTGTDAAGHVIEGIAYFVVGGDFIIGAIIFAILVVINFIVITKGSTRIAEVSARFSLDSMPGKQMAIDADLGAGLIDETEAKTRRKEVEGESSFFGAMDGAAKFVRGDAVAAIIITFVNIIGGLLIGTMRHGMDFSSAAQTYTILTIGDGLVSQIPALIVSVAAGMIVTKGATEGTASTAVTKQLSGSPRALTAAAILIFGLGLLPGFPFLMFTFLALLVGTMGLITNRTTKNAVIAAANVATAAEKAPEPEKPEDMIKVDAISLELGSGLVMMIGDQDAALPGKVRSLRTYFAKNFGFILPPVRIRDASDLMSGEYRISVQNVPAAQDRIIVGSRLVIDPDETVRNIPGVRVPDPTFGISSLWVDASRAGEAEAMGMTVVEPEGVIITHLTNVLTEHMPDLLTYGSTNDLIKMMDKEYQKLASDIPTPSPNSLIRQILQNLLAERVSIRNLPLIIEAIWEAAAATKSQSMITEHVRRKLSAQICASLEGEDGFLQVLTLGPSWETEFANSVKPQGDEMVCNMSPRRVQDFVTAARAELQKFAVRDERPPVLVSPDIRPIVRSMLERVSPMNPIISHGEIHRKTRLRTVGRIGD